MDYKAHYVQINLDLDRISIMRKYYQESIQQLLEEDESIDIFDEENEGFHDKCDSTFVAFFDHRMDCSVQEEVNVFNFDGVETDSDSVCYEDMTITEIMQCYRCIVEFKEWKETGKITY